MVAATRAAGLVAVTPAAGGNDTILWFSDVGTLTTSTLNVSQPSHLVPDNWMSTAVAGTGAGVLKGQVLNTATSGWFAPDQAKTSTSQPIGWDSHCLAARSAAD